MNKSVKGLIATLMIVLIATSTSLVAAQMIEEKMITGNTNFQRERFAPASNPFFIGSLLYNNTKAEEGNQTFRSFSIYNQSGVYNITLKIFDEEEIRILKVPAIDFTANKTHTIEQTSKRWSAEPNMVPLIIRDSMHGEVVQCKYFDDQVAIFFDNVVSEEETLWIYHYLSEIVGYIKERYGDIHSQRVYAIFYAGKHLGGQPSYYFDPQNRYQNIIYVGSDRWDQGFDWLRDAVLHEMAHIVESTVHGKIGSPAFDLWGDSKWSEFFEYAFYQEMGWDHEARRRYSTFINSTDDFPRLGTYWFRDWFYPLWRDYGGSAVMRKFYNLIAQHWGKAEKMNWGEFIHFMCAAVGEDLRDLASAAFSWSSEWELLFHQARIDYPQICNYYKLGVFKSLN